MTLPQLLHTSPNTVRSIIAKTILGPTPPPISLGSIHLYPHQLDALSRIQSALHDFHGALLCDDTGLGKTYVALALTISYPKTLIIAPAILKPMWTQAHTLAHTNAIDFMSMESLSYHSPKNKTDKKTDQYDLIIVDEAHHARNPHTKRHTNLSALCTNSDVLLMSATPIHNSHHDLTTLLSLFLHDHALTITTEDLSRILIRRTHTQTRLLHKLPKLTPTRWFHTPTSHTLLSPILNLPPPLPPRTAHTTPHLLTLSLVRQWCSSDHALLRAIHRRITQATALLTSINTGRYPTPQEIRAWLLTDDSIQLAFPELITNTIPITDKSLTTLHTTITRHTHALEHLLHQIPTPSPTDLRKAQGLRKLRTKHPNERIVAFSQYADTIITLFHHLKHDGHVAALTGKGGRISTGPIDRLTLIKHFAPTANNAPHPHTRDTITLLLTTDILSEGVNLQDASVIIHLDIPWTAATLNQRIGRIARIGSPHQHITTYGLIPPPEADKLLHTTTIIHRKSQLTHQTLGGRHTDFPSHTTHKPSSPTQTSIPEYTEAIRNLLNNWLTTHPHVNPTLSPTSPCLVATTPSCSPGFLAACIIDNTPTLITSTPEGTTTTTPKHIYNTLMSITSHPSPSPSTHAPASPPLPIKHSHPYHPPLTAITTWYTNLQATTDAGLTHLPPPTHPSVKRKRATLRRLSLELASTPWSQRPQLALQATTTLPTHTHPAPTLTFHMVALLLLTPPD